MQDVKAEDLRQMFLAMTEEVGPHYYIMSLLCVIRLEKNHLETYADLFQVRVIIVKLADRLHNMRTLAHMPPHKQVV